MVWNRMELLGMEMLGMERIRTKWNVGEKNVKWNTWNGLEHNGVARVPTECEMEHFGTEWNGLEQNEAA